MSAHCRGICLHLPHEKIVRWLSGQLKRLFRFCRKCDLYIRHAESEFFCKCCGCQLRKVAHSAREKVRKNTGHILANRRYRRKHRQFLNQYNRDYYSKNKTRKQEYYRIKIKNNRKNRTGEYAKYALRNLLLRIFFITLYPNLIMSQ